jgi:hypothetical protein
MPYMRNTMITRKSMGTNTCTIEHLLGFSYWGFLFTQLLMG